MNQFPIETANALYPKLAPEDRERAQYNLDQYFEVVLGIFLRREQEARELKNRRREILWRILTSCPHASTLKAKGRVFLENIA
jgi:hypothetical protein